MSRSADTHQASGPTLSRSPGFWLALAAALYSLVNAGRVFIDPAGFAEYLGLPLESPADDGFVYVYGTRTALLGAFVIVLLARRDLRTTGVLALLATALPVADAVLVARADAAAVTVARHVLIAVVLLVTALLLLRSTRGSTEPGGRGRTL